MQCALPSSFPWTFLYAWTYGMNIPIHGQIVVWTYFIHEVSILSTNTKAVHLSARPVLGPERLVAGPGNNLSSNQLCMKYREKTLESLSKKIFQNYFRQIFTKVNFEVTKGYVRLTCLIFDIVVPSRLHIIRLIQGNNKRKNKIVRLPTIYIGFNCLSVRILKIVLVYFKTSLIQKIENYFETIAFILLWRIGTLFMGKMSRSSTPRRQEAQHNSRVH